VAHSIGGRIAELRRRRGLTQLELAEAIPLSYSYISLIEAGKRNPRKQVVTLLADQLGCTPEYLVTGRGPAEARALDLDLRFAELALRSGDAASAEERFRSVLEQARAQGDAYDSEALRALWGLSRSASALGHMDTALRASEAVARAKQLPKEISRPIVLLSVCRSYLECGDVNRAIDVGEAALREAEDDRTFRAQELAELQSTVALCYYERGDLTRAQLLLDDVLRLADSTGSLRARGASLWNAALVAEAKGDLKSAELMTEAALAAYGEEERAVATATVRANAAALQMRVGGTPLDVVEQRLRVALARLHDVEAPMMVVVETEANLAQCRLRRGDAEDAVEIARAALSKLGDEAPLEAGRVRAVLAEALLALASDDQAVAHCIGIAETLDGAAVPQRVKSALASLADALYRSGRADEAVMLYRRIVHPWPGYGDDRRATPVRLRVAAESPRDHHAEVDRAETAGGVRGR